jgi:hypothetical protein
MEYYQHHIEGRAMRIGAWLVVLAAALLTVLGMLVSQ